MLDRFIENTIDGITKFQKRFVVFTSDLLSTLFAIFTMPLFTTTIHFQFSSILFILSVQAFSYWVFGLYRGIWRFASLPDLIRITEACFIGTIILMISHFYVKTFNLLDNFPFPLFCLLSICTLSGTRLSYRWIRDDRKILKTGKKVLVIGAGSAGESILRELKRKANKDFLPVGLIDDDPNKLGTEIHTIRVLGNTEELPKIAKDKEAELILIAIPTANSAQMRRVVKICEETAIPYRTLPKFNDIASGKAEITHIRHVSVEDLLSRDPIQFDHAKFHKFVANKRILITGGGGSIGSELCRIIAECHPACIILIEHSECNLFQIQNELQQKYPDVKLCCHLVSITHYEAVNHIMQTYKPDYVFHAAAYKHVPLLELQVRVAIENNVFGTQIIANAAVENGVKKFILVSTDKAVNPSNVMGATKRCAEIICQYLNQESQTDFITVRFGNVLGSAGSVVLLFKEQISQGGPITITHPDMQRYFMTIEEAAKLIIQTVAIEKASSLYVLDMGEPVKIQYLAEQMIKLSGHKPNQDIKIIYNGIRPGEKINEELFYPFEKALYSNYEKILQIDMPKMNTKQFMHHFSQLKHAFLTKNDNLKKHLFALASFHADSHSENVEEVPFIDERAARFAMENLMT